VIDAAPHKENINNVIKTSEIFNSDYTVSPGADRNRAWDLIKYIKKRIHTIHSDPYCRGCGEELRYCSCG